MTLNQRIQRRHRRRRVFSASPLERALEVGRFCTYKKSRCVEFYNSQIKSLSASNGQHEKASLIPKSSRKRFSHRSRCHHNRADLKRSRSSCGGEFVKCPSPPHLTTSFLIEYHEKYNSDSEMSDPAEDLLESSYDSADGGGEQYDVLG